MTEYRRANGSLEALEGIVAVLLATGEAEPTADEKAKFAEAQAKVDELAPIAEKMRKKCEARAELEVLKGTLSEKLNGKPEDAVKTAEELVDGGGAGAEEITPLLQRAHELESIATYGAKMAEKVLDLLQRFDASMAHMQTKLVPRLAGALAVANAEAAAKRAAEEHEVAAKRAEEERLAAEEARQTVIGLMAENEEKMQAQLAKEREAEEERLAEEKAKRDAELAAQLELEALLREEQLTSEFRIQEVGKDGACGEALAAMLATAVGPYRDAVEALAAMVGGVAAEPEIGQRRLLRCANETFQQQLGRRPGVWLFLRGVGFEPRTRDALPSGLLASLGVGGGPATERFLLLTEPNMMEAYEDWLVWHERIKVIGAFLEDLQRFAFQRTASLGQQGLDLPMRTVLSAGEVLQRWESRGGR